MHPGLSVKPPGECDVYDVVSYSSRNPPSPGYLLCRLHLCRKGERTASERTRGQCVHVVAAGQGDEAVERVVAAHHVIEFGTVGGDGVRVTEHDRNGCVRMRARVTAGRLGNRHVGRARRRTGRRESARTSAAHRAEWGELSIIEVKEAIASSVESAAGVSLSAVTLVPSCASSMARRVMRWSCRAGRPG